MPKKSYRYWVSVPADGTREFISSREMKKSETIIAEAIKIGIVDADDLCDDAGMDTVTIFVTVDVQNDFMSGDHPAENWPNHCVLGSCSNCNKVG
jgi:hypothetical protein